ncbi:MULTISPECIES: hypothetical protein [unclassified Mesorhizobium]|uniref:hypothetical protein n=1 Tax=unclassified Mesorhizobium TaxID=325217 RepID=UPI001FEF5282|nr:MULTISPECIES: hypothetical protein [unclassified Mesorhizobium]
MKDTGIHPETKVRIVSYMKEFVSIRNQSATKCGFGRHDPDTDRMQKLTQRKQTATTKGTKTNIRSWLSRISITAAAVGGGTIAGGPVRGWRR